MDQFWKNVLIWAHMVHDLWLVTHAVCMDQNNSAEIHTHQYIICWRKDYYIKLQKMSSVLNQDLKFKNLILFLIQRT